MAGGLYVRRNLTAHSAAALMAWATAQGFKDVTRPEEMHATIVWSIDDVTLEPVGGVERADDGGRSVTRLGDNGAIVLTIRSEALTLRWAEAIAVGAFWEYSGYTPHVTISWGGDGDHALDLAAIEPFEGELEFGPEVHSEFNDDKRNVTVLRAMQIEAMALNLPYWDNHPNRMPFSGILTRIDKPSDVAPHGSGGKRVLLTRYAAEHALPSLLGMAVDLTPGFDGHDVKRKIGLITEANIEGDAITIRGFVYAADFPEEAKRIKRDADELGFSYEMKHVGVIDQRADPLVIESCVFTGAAILKKLDGAYHTTSLAAARERQKEIDMKPEEIAALLATAVTKAMEPVTARLDKIEASQTSFVGDLEAGRALHAKVKPLADQVRAVGVTLHAAGIGIDAQRGHVATINRIADHMEAEARMGRTPTIYEGNDFFASRDDKSLKDLQAAAAEKDKALDALKATVDDLTTKLADVSARAFQAAAEPGRKTISADGIALMNKYAIDAGGEKLSITQVNAALDKMGIKGTRAIEAKLRLHAAGAITDTTPAVH